jgi:hypothetical protein
MDWLGFAITVVFFAAMLLVVYFIGGDDMYD